MTIGFLLTCKSHSKKTITKKIRNLSNDNMDQIKGELITKNWNYTSTNVNELYSSFLINIQEATDKIAPVKTITVSKTPWLTQNIRIAQQERDNAYKRFKLTRSEEDWNDYKQKRNRMVTAIRREKTVFYEENIDRCKGNSKKMWRTLKDLVGSRKNDELIFDVSFQGNAEDLEEKFNHFYASSIREIAETIPNQTAKFTIRADAGSSDITLSNFNSINLSQLKRIVTNLKNKSTSDEICDIKFLKNVFDQVGYPLLHLVNTSLSTGMVPSDAKISVIVPIPKVSNPSKPEEFRPINLLPVIDKVLETVVCRQLREYFEGHNLIFSGQSGFRERHSCESALQNICTGWKKGMK